MERYHPAQRILERVNRWYTSSDLWRAAEIYLNLWGAAFWAIERDEHGQPEIWPLRPDRVSIVPDRRQYIRGFVYNGRNGPVAYTPEEIVWFRYFNPLEEYAGLSPIAPVRMSADTGKDSLRFNRNFLRNSAQPDFVLLTKRSGTSWTEQANLTATGAAVNHKLGISVSVSGSDLVAGAPGDFQKGTDTGAAHIFTAEIQ